MKLDKSQIALFQETVWEYYHQYGRDLPWRQPEADGSFDAYKILVSELMLQQTQAPRVIPKYHEFLGLFPDVQSLSVAPLGEVIMAWSGLGYNRRAKFLWQAAHTVAERHDGSVPLELDQLTALSGVGINTAAAIQVYAFNIPVAFIETNIRTVYIHHFFADQDQVGDKEILELVSQTLDKENPREWYWALMDYGTHLKKTVGNASRQSRHFSKQSRFEGSRRQLRGKVLRSLVEGQKTTDQLAKELTDDRLSGVIADLQNEQMITKQGDYLSLY